MNGPRQLPTWVNQRDEPSGERESPTKRVLKSKFFGGVPVTAAVRHPEGAQWMDGSESRLWADERGVWRQNLPWPPGGLTWSEVRCVSGYKLDGVTTAYTQVTLESGEGESVEAFEFDAGFALVVAEVVHRLPDITPDWLAQIEQLRVGDAPIEVWRRAEPGAAPDTAR